MIWQNVLFLFCPHIRTFCQNIVILWEIHTNSWLKTKIESNKLLNSNLMNAIFPQQLEFYLSSFFLWNLFWNFLLRMLLLCSFETLFVLEGAYPNWSDRGVFEIWLVESKLTLIQKVLIYLNFQKKYVFLKIMCAHMARENALKIDFPLTHCDY